MGALHQGHLSLIQRCRQDNSITVVSLFVNPLQFGPHEDLDRYPRPFEQDVQVCEAAGVDLLFAPSVASLWGERGDPPSSKRTQIIPPPHLLAHLCAPFRPGHFEGVLTIVMKLLQLVQPQRAYFGEKDIQQCVLIERMVSELSVPVEIVPCPTVRDPDGLALSSRNAYLTPEQRPQATQLHRGLSQGKQAFQQGEREAHAILAAVSSELAPSLRVQYLQLVDPVTLQPLERIQDQGLLAMAAFVGETRLIDNVRLSIQTPIIAIDGPAGAGKSTVARMVALELNLTYIDTGAMYRAVTWLALEKGIPLQDEPALAELVAESDIRLDRLVSLDIPVRTWINGQDVTEAIRSLRVTQQVSTVAALPGVRQELVRLQQEMGRLGGAVLEGRDIGTYVFPKAELKIFLTASVGERARRRWQELAALGQSIDRGELEVQIAERDRLDSERTIAPLRQAADAILIDTDQLPPQAVLAKIVELYRQRIQS